MDKKLFDALVCDLGYSSKTKSLWAYANGNFQGQKIVEMFIKSGIQKDDALAATVYFENAKRNGAKPFSRGSDIHLKYLGLEHRPERTYSPMSQGYIFKGLFTEPNRKNNPKILLAMFKSIKPKTLTRWKTAIKAIDSIKQTK